MIKSKEVGWLFFSIVHTLRLEDAGIIGAGHETIHQRCALVVNGEDLDERGGMNLWKNSWKCWIDE
jgi:hypothetical protein